MSAEHIPVLASELVELTAPGPGETVVDCTFGGGGHAGLLAERVGATGALIAVDRDPVAEERFEDLTRGLDARARFLRSGFADALRTLRAEGVVADVVVFDLGVSSMQVDTRERGFSYSYDAPLDMRMDPTRGESARDLLARLDERELAGLLRRLGEDPNARAIAREVVRRRERAPVETTSQLVDAIESAIPAPVRRRFGGGHPAKRVFQALRIAVNDELGELDAALPEAWELLGAGGRLAAISFHSLEDRRVKRFLADRARGCVCPPDFPVCVCGRIPEAELLTTRAVKPTAAELAENPRAKSGRLRAARKLEPEVAG